MGPLLYPLFSNLAHNISHQPANHYRRIDTLILMHWIHVLYIRVCCSHFHIYCCDTLLFKVRHWHHFALTDGLAMGLRRWSLNWVEAVSDIKVRCRACDGMLLKSYSTKEIGAGNAEWGSATLIAVLKQKCNTMACVSSERVCHFAIGIKLFYQDRGDIRFLMPIA